MKKDEIKTGRTKPPEGKTREQLEDRAFNRMLLWLAAVAVVEVVMVLINRFYLHTRVSEIGMKMPLYYVLTAFPIVGVALFVVFLLWAKKRYQEDSGKDGFLQLVLSLSCIFCRCFNLSILKTVFLSPVSKRHR